MGRETVICMMAKAPVPGAVKTRLSPPLSPEQAARLAAGFLEDTWRTACSVERAAPLLCWAGRRDDFPRSFAGVDGFAQPDIPDLGTRIEAVAREGLRRAERVLVIGSDLPGLPVSSLVQARAALADHDAVLGPSRDGGFYVIGMRRCEQGLLADLPWSSPETYRACAERLVARGYALAFAPPYDDVDDAADVRSLGEAIDAGTVRAPATAAVLSELSGCDSR